MFHQQEHGYGLKINQTLARGLGIHPDHLGRIIGRIELRGGRKTVKYIDRAFHFSHAVRAKILQKRGVEAVGYSRYIPAICVTEVHRYANIQARLPEALRLIHPRSVGAEQRKRSRTRRGDCQDSAQQAQAHYRNNYSCCWWSHSAL